ncbi:MAG: LuxR C-terminal-related transcriptional regulator [Henriciella sp.]
MADRETHAESIEESRAEAALVLLQSLARAGEDPEKFAQACRDWAKLSDNVEALPEFESVLSILTPALNEPEAPSSRLQSEAIATTDSFTLDEKGCVTNITKDVSTQFELQVGDILHPSIELTSKAGATSSDLLVERPDRFGISRQIKLYPKLTDGVAVGYTGRVFLFRLSSAVRTHLVNHFGLTSSETEILELLLRRHRLEQIADLRGIKLNTVRTHVARLNSKLGSRSLTETLSMTVELSQALSLRAEQPHVLITEDENASRLISLPNQDQSVEYRRYGPANGHPVMILHSLEYGYLPSKDMIAAARRAGINLIFPLRPGFGDTTVTGSIEESATLLSEFIRVLDWRDMTLVGQSTSAPLALEVQTLSSRIGKTVLINYGLDIADKLSAIQPNWLSGLLRMGLSSQAGFAFGARSLRSVSETFGGTRFYRMMYRNQASDRAYFEANTKLFEITSDYLYGADLAQTRLDLESAFLDNPRAATLLSSVRPLVVMNSADQQGVGPEAAEAAAERLGLDFRPVAHSGRNWIYQFPETLFNEVLR